MLYHPILNHPIGPVLHKVMELGDFVLAHAVIHYPGTQKSVAGNRPDLVIIDNLENKNYHVDLGRLSISSYLESIKDAFLRLFYYHLLKYETGLAPYPEEYRRYELALTGFYEKLTRGQDLRTDLAARKFHTHQSRLSLRIESGLELHVTRDRTFDRDSKRVYNTFTFQTREQSKNKLPPAISPVLTLTSWQNNGREGSHRLLYREPEYKTVIDMVFNLPH